ncbi:S-layer homology domain-containing protein [Anoxybacterium hadale]|uniref:S-layer homology domain-containing protein n=1 Tax=Anoxybacterium hadale TaxID=3408580 RepID=UPI003B0037F8
MKRQFKTLAALTLVLALSSTTAFAAVPADVKGQPYEKAVTALVEKGIITGDADGSFNPEAQLTRAQACIIVVKSMNPPAAEVTGTATQPAPKSGFSDLSGYGWAEGYISYAVKSGVSKGYPDGTFKPGNKVTMDEFITMVLRAADYSDQTLGGTWPQNYTSKADELKLMEGIDSVAAHYATKWMAAQFSYNALDIIEKANLQEETPSQSTDNSGTNAIPDTSKMSYTAAGSFNDSMTAYNGRTISNNVKIYTYGLKKDYKQDMTFSKKASDYLENTVYKYKNVSTPAFCQVENNKITTIVLPGDVGFSGRAYGVINGTVKTVNASGEAVTGVETLTATKEITWLAKKNLSGIPTSSSSYLDGTVYELYLSNGEIQNIAAAEGKHKGKVFEELSGEGSDFVEVESYADGVVTTTGGKMFAVKDNASVYVLNKADADEYKAGRASSIKAGVEIRAYDISDDKENSADIIVIMK